MTDWKADYAARRWDVVENWWRNCDDAPLLQELLEWLERDVPRVAISNGMEERQEFMHPKDAPEEWKGAAEILFLGELKAAIEGDPTPELDEWHETSQQTASLMRSLIDQVEPTKGSPALSRKAHAENALDYLERVELDATLMCNELDPDGTAPDDREWLRAVIAQAALAGFHAGAHARAAIGKEMERYAVSGKKASDGSARGGAIISGQKKRKREEVLAAMNKLIANGKTISLAAVIAHRSGLGHSPEANRKTYYRHSAPKK